MAEKEKIDFTESIRGVDEERAQWESDMLNNFLDYIEENVDNKK